MNKLLILIMVLLMSTAVRPTGAEETMQLEEVVVTATRAEEEIEKISSNVTVITREEIRKSTATTVQDLLRNEEGLIIRDLYGTGTKSTVDMRGFGRGINTTVLIDGKKVNNIDLSGVDWNLIPLENVERIEIVRGGGSVLYGDNAIAGVINIITKKGRKLKPEIELDARIESYSGNKEHFTVRGAAERLSYFLLLKRRETDGYRDNSEFDANDVNSNVMLSITDYLHLDINAGYHEDQQGLPGGLTKIEVDNNRRQTTEPRNGVDYDQYFYGANLVLSLGWGEIEAGYKFNSRELADKLSGDLGGTIFNSDTERDTDTDDIKLKLTARPNLYGYKNILVAGFDYSRSNVDNKNVFDFFGISTTLAEITKREAGFYIENELFLSDSLIFTAGYRYTEARYKDSVTTDFSSGSGSQKFNENAIKAGLAYNYADGAKLFASYSRGFRLPTTDELFSFDGSIVRLKSERADTYEVGIVHPFRKNFRTRLTLYRMNVRDELFLNPFIGFFGENENIDKTRHQGAEIGFTAEVLDFISFFGNYTYTEVEFKSDPYKGNTLPLIPRHSANLGVDIKLKDSILLALKANWVGKHFLENDVENNKEKLPSYLTADMKFSYQYKMVTAYFGVNNIFNEKYSEYGAFGASSGNIKFYPAPERNYYGGIRISL
jgi:iron complex outermembrane receptor protein